MMGSLVVSKDSYGAREILERNWGDVIDTNDPTSTIEVNIEITFRNTQYSQNNFLMEFLPLYLSTTFLKCQKCGNCCRPDSKWRGKGAVLSKEEMLLLRQYSRIIKRNGQYLLKYPCPLLKTKRCSQFSLFLTSEDSSFIADQAIIVDGSVHMYI